MSFVIVNLDAVIKGRGGIRSLLPRTYPTTVVNRLEAVNSRLLRKQQLAIIAVFSSRLQPVVSYVRSLSGVPLIVFGTKQDDSVAALDAGADDYLVYPCDRQELTARIEAVLRRPPQLLFMHTTISIGALDIDIKNHRAVVGGVRLPLTPAEYKIGRLLAVQKNRVVGRDLLAAAALPDRRRYSRHLLDMHVLNLRRKIKAAASIKTIPQYGFMLTECIKK